MRWSQKRIGLLKKKKRTSVVVAKRKKRARDGRKKGGWMGKGVIHIEIRKGVCHRKGGPTYTKKGMARC